jgi:uncharacterized spore protein YtfJ
MSIGDLIGKIVSARTVYTDPVEKDGVTVVPAALVLGGGGFGVGRRADGDTGEGGGFGVLALPVGAYVIKDGTARWRPAIDLGTIAATAIGVALVIFVRRR